MATIIQDPELESIRKKYPREMINGAYWKHGPNKYKRGDSYKPWQYIAMMVLMLAKKIPSFRNLHKELGVKANKHYRQFCGFRYGKVPARSRLNEFSKTMSDEMWDEIMGILWNDLMIAYPEIEELPLVVGIDSMDQGVNSKYDKKTKTFTDEDASIGHRTAKFGERKTFGGHRKNTIKLLIPELHMILPLYSRVETASLKEETKTVEYYELLKKFSLYQKKGYAIGLGDLAFVGAPRKKEMRKNLNISFITGMKKNMVIDPELYDEEGHPTCQEGYRMVWRGETEDGDTHVYKGEDRHCDSCPLKAVCDRQFELEAATHETLLGAIPYHMTGEVRRRLRPQIEIPNYWDKQVCLDDVRFKRSQHTTRTLARSYDVFKLLSTLAKDVSYYRSKKIKQVKPDQLELLPLAA